MGNKKTQEIPLVVTELVETPPVKVSGRRRIEDLDFLDTIADDAILIIQYGTRTFRTTKALLFGSLGKIYLTQSALLDPSIDGVIEYSDSHLYFTHGDTYSLTGSLGVKIDTSTVENTTTETNIYTHTIKPDSLHHDMRVLFSLAGTFSTDSASETFTIRYKVDGVTIHTIIINPANGTDIAWRAHHEGTIRTAGASGGFIDFSEFAESEKSPIYQGDLTIHPIDTTIAILYEVTVQWGAAKAGNSFSSTQGDLTYKH